MSTIEEILDETHKFDDLISNETYDVYYEKDVRTDLIGEYTEITVFVEVNIVDGQAQDKILTEGLHFDEDELQGIEGNLSELLLGVAKNMINYRLNHQALVKKSNDINDI